MRCFASSRFFVSLFAILLHPHYPNLCVLYVGGEKGRFFGSSRNLFALLFNSPPFHSSILQPSPYHPPHPLSTPLPYCPPFLTFVHQGYAPLFVESDYFYITWLFKPMSDAWDRPITNVPGTYIDVIERKSTNENASYTYVFSPLFLGLPSFPSVPCATSQF